MFMGAEHKPISIIITTLAACAYDGEDDVLIALTNAVSKMDQFIETRYDTVKQKSYYWIGNPVNPAENFADKWPLCQEKEENFWKWMRQVKKDVALIAQQESLYGLREAIEKPFGEDLVKSVFMNIGQQTKSTRESGGLFMSAGSGLLGSIGRTPVPSHKYFGGNEQ